MSKHEGIIVATDETDHIAFLCPKCDKAMSVLSVSTSEKDGWKTAESLTRIYLKCPGCGYDHWRKFDWAGGTATICKHRTDAHSKMIGLLGRVEAFIAGFEDDESQVGIPALLTDVKLAKGGKL